MQLEGVNAATSKNAKHSKVKTIDSCCWILWAMCAGIDPGLNELAEPRLGAWRGRSASTRIPTPGNQVILGEVLMQQGQVAPSVTGGVLKLRADFAYRF